MSFYENKRVTITGGAGFVGTYLCHLLLKAGAIVTVMDIKPPRQVNTGVTYLNLDARQLINCHRAFKGADVVFNLAAKVAGVEFNQHNNLKMMHENIPLQIVPVVAATDLETPHFLQVSSVCVYPNGETSPCNDNINVADMRPPNLANYGYATSKRIGELSVMQSTLKHWIIARPTNIYGPGDDFGPNGHVIPALIKRSVDEDRLIVNGTGKEVREFLYVEDAARAMMHLVEHGKSGVYNLGNSGRDKATIKELAELIRHATATGYKPLEFKDKFNAGDNERYTDSHRLEATGFKPSVSLREGISQTVDWWWRKCR